jgi:hypothetical protein
VQHNNKPVQEHHHKHFLITSLCNSSTIMKRATICLVCSQKVGQGFALINHKRLCKSRVNVNPPAQQEVINQQLQELPDHLESHAHADDPEEQHQDQDIVP